MTSTRLALVHEEGVGEDTFVRVYIVKTVLPEHPEFGHGGIDHVVTLTTTPLVATLARFGEQGRGGIVLEPKEAVRLANALLAWAAEVAVEGQVATLRNRLEERLAS